MKRRISNFRFGLLVWTGLDWIGLDWNPVMGNREESSNQWEWEWEWEGEGEWKGECRENTGMPDLLELQSFDTSMRTN